MPYKLIFGYKHVGPSIPRCPCRDPGNYMSLSQNVEDPLDLLFRCWCGRTMKATMDTPEELAELLRKLGVN